MEDQERTRPEEEEKDVEAHRRGHQPREGEEPKDEAEAEGEDDVELHRRGHQAR